MEPTRDKKADLAGPGIGDYEELARILPEDYSSILDPHETQKAALEKVREVRTPAMQAGLTKKRLTFCDIFVSIPNFLRLVRLVHMLVRQGNSTLRDNFVIPIAA